MVTTIDPVSEGEGAIVEALVSGIAWGGFPQLRRSVERWATLSGHEAAGLVITAVDTNTGYVSIRVTAAAATAGGDPLDWREFIVPREWIAAGPEALDHFVQRSINRAVEELRGVLAPVRVARPGGDEAGNEAGGSEPMAATRSGGKGPASKPVEAAPATVPATTRARPGPKPKAAAATPAATATATRNRPGPKPRTRATEAAAAIPEAPASKPPKRKPGPKPKAKRK